MSLWRNDSYGSVMLPYAFTAFDAADRQPVPRLFVAVTVHVYFLPGVSLLTVTWVDRCDHDRVVPPFDDVQVAVYLAIAAPLFFEALNDTLMAPFMTFDADTEDGVAGVPIVTGPVGSDCGPTPEPVTAATLNV